MDTYDDIEKELVDELGSLGIAINLTHTSVGGAVAVQSVGHALLSYTDKMVERALKRVAEERRYAELGRSLDSIIAQLADHNIEIRVVEAK